MPTQAEITLLAADRAGRILAHVDFEKRAFGLTDVSRHLANPMIRTGLGTAVGAGVGALTAGRDPQTGERHRLRRALVGGAIGGGAAYAAPQAYSKAKSFVGGQVPSTAVAPTTVGTLEQRQAARLARNQQRMGEMAHQTGIENLARAKHGTLRAQKDIKMRARNAIDTSQRYLGRMFGSAPPSSSTGFQMQTPAGSVSGPGIKIGCILNALAHDYYERQAGWARG